MKPSNEFTTDMIIQYSIVGLILLVSFGWILWKMMKKNKSKTAGGCCGCTIADSCKKKTLISSENSDTYKKPCN